MWTEDKVPIESRYLYLEGKVSPSSLQLVAHGLPAHVPANTEILFVGYSYADLPLGQSFPIMFVEGNPASAIFCESKISAVTQQLGHPTLVVPYGWKTICFVEFPQGIPKMIHNLPTLDSWGRISGRVFICSEETLEAIKRDREDGV